MSREDILSRLRAHEDELRAMGVRELAVFGSVASGEDAPQSDVDLLVSIEPRAELSLLGMVRIERRLRDLLEREVDLIEREMLPPSLAREISRGILRAF